MSDLKSVHGMTFWFTGLSGSGKTTVSSGAKSSLSTKIKPMIILDGDQLRQSLSRDLGFDIKSRLENLRRAAAISALLNKQGIHVLASFITPTNQARSLVKNIVGTKYYREVYISTSLEVCEKRDVKGLYHLARAAKIQDFTGIDSPFEIPGSPDLIVETEDKSIQSSILVVHKYIEQQIFKT